jgi:hypothetical protein
VRLSIVRGGGLAGIATQTTLDRDELPPDGAAAFDEQVAAAGGFEQAGPPPPTHPDEQLYEVKLDDGEERVARFTDTSLPDGVRRLVEWAEGRPERKTEILPPGT